MTLSFDNADWIIGLTLIGGTALMILIGCMLMGRTALGFAWVLLGVTLSITAVAGIDLLLQTFTSEAFWSAGSHKRSAMRTFMPFGLGLSGGMVGSGLLLGWITK